MVGGRVAGTALVAASDSGARSFKTRLRWLRRAPATQFGQSARLHPARSAATALGAVAALSVAATMLGIFVGVRDRDRPAVPAVIGQPLHVATERLAAAGLRTRGVILVEAESPANTVIAVSPPPGKRAPSDGSVDLIVAK